MSVSTQSLIGPVVALQSEVAIVTGAGSPPDTGLLGIGAAIAIYFTLAGADVVIVDRDQDAANRTVRRIADVTSAEHVRSHVRQATADVIDLGDCERAAQDTVEAFGAVTTLVNNVGIAGPVGSAAELDLAMWTPAMTANVRSMVTMSRAVLPAMSQAGHGSIINMSSVAGLRGGHHGLAYPTSKAAVIGLTRAMAAHHGSDGVTVNALVPGLAYTPMVASRGLTQQQRETRRRAGMVDREGTAWDVAGAAAFLASSAARWITGAVLPVDGGLSALAGNLGVRRDQ